MGYETKLIIGKKSETRYGSEPSNYFSVYAEVNLCKCGKCNLLDREYGFSNGKPLVYWYADDGNTRMTKDRYDSMPIPIPIEDVIKALKKDIKEGSYRRFHWALSLLLTMRETNEGEELSVLFFGY